MFRIKTLRLTLEKRLFKFDTLLTLFFIGIAAGATSDALFNGRRAPAMLLFCLIAAPAAFSMIYLPSSFPMFNSALVVVYFTFGFGTFGPHMLVGLTARELFPRWPSTAGSFSKSLAQVGGAAAGVPLSMVAESYGWYAVATGWAVSLSLSALAFGSLYNVSSQVKEKEE